MSESSEQPKISLKISTDDGWLVSEADSLDVSGLKCRIEKSLQKESKVQIVMMIPGDSNKASKKINCEGIVVSTNLVSTEGTQALYDVIISLVGLTSPDKKVISALAL